MSTPETDALLHGLKRCSSCRQEKPATPEYFGRNAAAKDGLTYSCRECKNGRGREEYARNVRRERAAEASRKPQSAQRGRRTATDTPQPPAGGSRSAEGCTAQLRAARSLVALQAHAVASCQALAPPASGEWSAERERAFDYACAFSDGVNAAISALTGISPMPARLLTVAEVRRRLAAIGYGDMTAEAIERSMRRGALGGREIAGRWYCTEAELRAYVGSDC